MARVIEAKRCKMDTKQGLSVHFHVVFLMLKLNVLIIYFDSVNHYIFVCDMLVCFVPLSEYLTESNNAWRRSWKDLFTSRIVKCSTACFK